MQQKPLIIGDVAHNESGIKEVMQQWSLIPAKSKHIVVGFVKDKDVAGVLKLFPADNTYYFCAANIPRALPANDLVLIAKELGLEGNTYSSVADAVHAAKQNLTTDDALLITGSFFILGEAMEYMDVNNGLLFPSALE